MVYKEALVIISSVHFKGNLEAPDALVLGQQCVRQC